MITKLSWAIYHIYGGSSTLDYAFLFVICKKYDIKGFCEIGSYIGTSIENLYPMLEKCLV